MEKITLDACVNEKITSNSFESVASDAHGLVKIIVVATSQERAYDLFHIMMAESRKDYSCDLFEKIETTPWYDFDLQKQNKYVVAWKLETVADEEELLEYFSECMEDFTQAFGDIIIEMVFKETIEQGTKIYTHDDKIHVAHFNNK